MGLKIQGERILFLLINISNTMIFSPKCILLHAFAKIKKKLYVNYLSKRGSVYKL